MVEDANFFYFQLIKSYFDIIYVIRIISIIFTYFQYSVLYI